MLFKELLLPFIAFHWFNWNISEFAKWKCMLVQQERYCMICAYVCEIINSQKLVDYLTYIRNYHAVTYTYYEAALLH